MMDLLRLQLTHALLQKKYHENNDHQRIGVFPDRQIEIQRKKKEK